MPDHPPRLVLASGSPRRRALLLAAGYEFEVVIPDVIEQPLPDEAPAAMVERLAGGKVAAVAATVSAGVCVLGLDTTVVLDGRILGKPVDEHEALEMLMALSGRRHVVYTGYAVRLDDRRAVGVAITGVRFRPITPDEARRYVDSGEPLDKAGAYGIQGAGSAFVATVEGARSNVVGLPLREVIDVLGRFGIESGRFPGRIALSDPDAGFAQ